MKKIILSTITILTITTSLSALGFSNKHYTPNSNNSKTYTSNLFDRYGVSYNLVELDGSNYNGYSINASKIFNYSNKTFLDYSIGLGYTDLKESNLYDADITGRYGIRYYGISGYALAFTKYVGDEEDFSFKFGYGYGFSLDFTSKIRFNIERKEYDNYKINSIYFNYKF